MNSEILFTIMIWIFVLIVFIIACLNCRRVRILPSVFIIAFVTFFSLLSPAGEVLLRIGDFKITLDSMLLGLQRSGILVGMVFLSRAIVSSKNKNSFFSHFGKIGKKLSEVFFWFNLLTEKRINLKKGQIIESIDERLSEIWKSELPEQF